MTRTKAVKATVAAIIIRQDKDAERILFTRRNVEPFLGKFCLPGGHIDRFETAREAVVREVREETGLAFDPEFFHYFDEIIEALDWHAVVIAFVGPATGTLALQETEVAEARWLSVPEALSLEMAFHHHEIVATWARRTTR